MIYFFKFLCLLIQIDQEMILKWFGLAQSTDLISAYEGQNNDPNDSFSTFSDHSSTEASIETVKLIIDGLWNKLQDGLTLAEIENILFFILLIRFLALAVRYNVKTSFYITCITLASAYLWYRHLIDVMLLYRTILLRIPFFHKLGLDALQLRILSEQAVRDDIIAGENVHWYNVGQLLYYTFTKGIVDVDPITGLKSYIDPISMIVADLDEPLKSKITPYYYKLYNKIVPKIFGTCSRYWTQLSGLVAYALITRIAKRYCPYLVRWHWTVLLILGFPEQILVFLTNRMMHFQSFVLLPQLIQSEQTGQLNISLLVEVNFLNIALSLIAVAHMSFVMIGLFHAICGQYIYIPFLVENAELHIGPRPKNSVYSGGYTSWQDKKEKEKKLESPFPRLWYGWLGKPRSIKWNPLQFIVNYLRKILRLTLKKWMK